MDHGALAAPLHAHPAGRSHAADRELPGVRPLLSAPALHTQALACEVWVGGGGLTSFAWVFFVKGREGRERG